MAPRHYSSEIWRRLRWESVTIDNQRAVMARLGAYLYLAGALIVGVSALLPATGGRDKDALALVVVAAVFVALVILVLFDRIPIWGFNVFTALGSGLIALVIHFGGDTGSNYRPIYYWVILYAAYFFAPWQILLQLTLVGVFYGVALLGHHSLSDSLLPWTMFLASLIVTSGLVYALRSRLQTLLLREREHVYELEELDKAKDAVIAVISHELRTPLASVYGAAVTLKRRDIDPDRQEELLGVVARESERLANLIDSVLWTSRIDSADMGLEITDVDAREVIAEVVAAAASYAPDEVIIDVTAPEQLPPCRADRDKLVQALAALVENAVKYSLAGGHVEVQLEKSGRNKLRIAVSDEGIGIPLEHQDKVFDKFHRVDPQMHHGVGGSGLGLYIAQNFVTAMGGRLIVHSVPDQGSTFSFTLPLA
jgi:signal transduction histidine kinase